MKFSVIMPVYNVEAYVIEAVESILNQTYKDFELIIINDGSKDQTGDIADEYAKKDSRVIVIHKQNEGLSSARNLGIKNAIGEFIYFIDGDDYLDLNTFENIEFAIRNSSADVICFGIKTFKEESFIDNDINLSLKDEYYERKFLERREYSGIEFYEKQVENNSLVSSACLYVTKKSLIEENQLMFQPGIIHEDELFTRLLFIHAHKILFLENKFYNRRYRPNSITTIAQSEHNAISLLIIAEELYNINNTLRYSTLNKDVAKFYELSLALIEKLALTDNPRMSAVIKRLSKSPLSKTHKKKKIRLLILLYLDNWAIKLGVKIPIIRHLITPFILNNR